MLWELLLCNFCVEMLFLSVQICQNKTSENQSKSINLFSIYRILACLLQKNNALIKRAFGADDVCLSVKYIHLVFLVHVFVMSFFGTTG